MALTMGSRYDELIEGGTSIDAARAAAEEAARAHDPWPGIVAELASLKVLAAITLAMTATLLAKLLI